MLAQNDRGVALFGLKSSHQMDACGQIVAFPFEVVVPTECRMLIQSCAVSTEFRMLMQSCGVASGKCA